MARNLDNGTAIWPSRWKAEITAAADLENGKCECQYEYEI
jgi:hypothetical protein